MFQFIEETFRLLGDVIERLAEDFGKSKKPKYDAQFIKEREILSSRNGGFCLTGARNLSNRQSYQNALVIGSTGTGKSANILIPTLMSMKNASVIVNDPSGELLAKTGGYLKRDGFDVLVLNFANPEKSIGFNPIHLTNTASEVQKVSSMLNENGSSGNSKDKFWDTMATGLDTSFISILKTQPKEFQTPYNILQLLNALGANPKGVDKLFGDFASDQLFAEYKSFISLDEKIQTSTIATAKASLQIFNDEGVAKITSFDSIEMSEFRKKPIALFVQTSIGDAKYYSTLVSIFFQQFINYILSRFPEDHERDIFFLLDEASSLKIPVLPIAVANVRKHRAGVLLCVQSESQLQTNYSKSDAESIMANCFAKVYLTGQDHETTKKLESILGKIEYKDDDDKKNVMPLMTADSIRTMPLNKAILLCGHHKPILAKLYPYYENPTYRNNSKIPAPEMKCQIPFFNIPVLPFETPDEDEE